MPAPLRLVWSESGTRRAPEPAPPAPSRPAGLWSRAAACAIDLLAVIVGTGVLLFPIDAAAVTSGVPSALAAALGAVSVAGRIALAWLYFAGTESSERQATFGKIALGLAVEDGTGGRLAFGRATRRLAAKLLSLAPLGLGLALAAASRRRRALHDVIADTVVVRRGRPSAAGIGIAVAVAAVLAALATPNVLEAQARRAHAVAAASAAAHGPGAGRP